MAENKQRPSPRLYCSSQIKWTHTATRIVVGPLNVDYLEKQKDLEPCANPSYTSHSFTSSLQHYLSYLQNPNLFASSRRCVFFCSKRQWRRLRRSHSRLRSTSCSVSSSTPSIATRRFSFVSSLAMLLM